MPQKMKMVWANARSALGPARLAERLGRGVGYLARRSLLRLIPDPEFRHALRRRFCTVPERPRSHGGLQGLLVAGLPTPGHGERDPGPLGRLLRGFLARADAIAGSLR